MKKTTIKTIDWTKRFAKVALKEQAMQQLKGGDGEGLEMVEIIIEDEVVG